MSNVNIKRAVENIRSGTTVYTPIVETVVNAIQAIEAGTSQDGRIDIIVRRSRQQDLEGGLPPVESFTVIDNGIGFTDTNREAFDTLYTDQKIAQGGKGFGRFTCLKYFEDLIIESIYAGEDRFKKRSFRMGKKTDIIVAEKVKDCPVGETGSNVTMRNVKGRGFPDKKLETIARTLVERLLPYFIDADYNCPEISISEDDGTGRIVLNNFVSNQLAALIKEIPLKDGNISLGSGDEEKSFRVRPFKVYSP